MVHTREMPMHPFSAMEPVVPGNGTTFVMLLRYWSWMLMNVSGEQYAFAFSV